MHKHNQFDLLRERRFGPFFWTQFFGAANDNIYKNALVIFVAFHAETIRRRESGLRRISATTLAI